jgi:hypothetical protein
VQGEAPPRAGESAGDRQKPAADRPRGAQLGLLLLGVEVDEADDQPLVAKRGRRRPSSVCSPSGEAAARRASAARAAAPTARYLRLPTLSRRGSESGHHRRRIGGSRLREAADVTSTRCLKLCTDSVASSDQGLQLLLRDESRQRFHPAVGAEPDLLGWDHFEGLVHTIDQLLV